MRPQLPVRPSRQLAVLACMDSRIDLFDLLDLQSGEAHLIRNGGGILTDDSLRSLTMSQRLLGTQDVWVLQHTDCGMNGLDDAAFRAELAAETGFEPPWRAEGFTDVEANCRQTVEAIRTHPLLRCREVVGFLFDTSTREVSRLT